jgi:hypothetical protein
MGEDERIVRETSIQHILWSANICRNGTSYTPKSLPNIATRSPSRMSTRRL